MNRMKALEARFDMARQLLLGELVAGEALTIDFAGDDSLFMRFNDGKVRQIGGVDEAYLSFRLFKEGRSVEAGLTLSGESGEDTVRLAASLAEARSQAGLLPEDPFRRPPEASGSSSVVFEGKLPKEEAVVEEVLGPAAGFDFVGIHTQGAVARGAANSSGARHWFASETFQTDWSMWLPNGKAVKSLEAGRTWDRAAHEARIQAAADRLDALARQERKLEPGSYRAYISPDALDDVMTFFSWNGLSERSMREGRSAWLALKDGRKSLSPLFSLAQDFGLGVEPAFNELGEVAPERLDLIRGGKLASTIVSSRSAAQYGLPSNQSPDWEGVRSPSVAPGELEEAKALEALGTGVYVSNFHYLNWSDVESARITGMTRFACFWVEGGKLVAPIKDMRFDESLYELLGSRLEALTRERSLIPSTGSYVVRSVGGSLLPGILVSGLTFTL